MCFHSRWQFAPGTQIGVNLCYPDAGGDCKKAALEGIVVDCQPSEAPQKAENRPPSEERQAAPHKCYRVTVLFLDLSEPLRGVIRDFSCLTGVVREPAPESPSVGASLPPLTFRGPGQRW